jgi:hypothetical protein
MNTITGETGARQALCYEFMSTTFGQTVLYRVQAISRSCRYHSIIRYSAARIARKLYEDNAFIVMLLQQTNMPSPVSSSIP